MRSDTTPRRRPQRLSDTSVTEVVPAPALIDLVPQHATFGTRHIMGWVKRGSDIQASNPHGTTPLMVAARRGLLDVVMYLTGRGARVNAMDRHGYTAFALAAWHNHLEVMRYLRSRGANPNAVAPLVHSARLGRPEVTRALLAHGTSPDLTDRQGYTALMWAAISGHREVAACLLAHGGEVSTRNAEGLTAFQYALRHSHYRLASLLESGHNGCARHGLRHMRLLLQVLRSRLNRTAANQRTAP